MDKIMLVIKGFIVGTANIIPGVSGGTIMMSLGIFENIIYSINHFFSDVKKNTMYLLCILVGVFLSIIIMSRVITYALSNFQFPTILFFIGLIIGGFPMLLKKINGEKNKKIYVLSFLIPFLIVLSMSIFDGTASLISLSNMGVLNYILLFLMGLIAAGSMIVPGLSGSFMLILFGYYEPIMQVIKDFTSFNEILSNGCILFVFGLGILAGLFLVIRLIEILLAKYKVGTYYSIMGFVSASVISIVLTNFSGGIDFSVLSTICAVILFVFGFIATYKLGD